MRRAVLAYGFSFSSAPRFRSGFFFSAARFGPSCNTAGHDRSTLLALRTLQMDVVIFSNGRQQPCCVAATQAHIYQRHSTAFDLC